MILTDREIQIALENHQIILDPPPDLARTISSTSIDLTLSEKILIWKDGVKNFLLTPASADYDYLKLVEDMTTPISIAESYELKPGDFMLGWTVEVLKLPSSSRVAARVEGKSSLARLGIAVHMTAPTIHAGFGGTIQLEIKNNGPLRVALSPGMKICQLIFEQTFGTPEKGYAGRFLGQQPA